MLYFSVILFFGLAIAVIFSSAKDIKKGKAFKKQGSVNMIPTFPIFSFIAGLIVLALLIYGVSNF